MPQGSRHDTLKKALQLVFYLAEHRFGATLNDLMEETGLTRRNLYHYFDALKAAGVGVVRISPRGPGIVGVYRLENRPKYARLLSIM